MFVKIRNFFKYFFSSREKRIEYILEGLKDLQTVLKSNVTTGALTAAALINSGVAASLTTGKKALITVLPEIIKIFEIMAASDDYKILSENIASIKKQLVTEGFTEEEAEKATDTITEMLKDGKLTIKEVLNLLIYLNNL